MILHSILDLMWFNDTTGYSGFNVTLTLPGILYSFIFVDFNFQLNKVKIASSMVLKFKFLILCRSPSLYLYSIFKDCWDPRRLVSKEYYQINNSTFILPTASCACIILICFDGCPSEINWVEPK